MPIDIRISTGTPSPIYRQLVDQIRLAVATGALSPGEELPSVRGLAERLLVNPNTIARAYSELVSEGVIESRAGKGMLVAERRSTYTKSERLRRLDPALTALAQQALHLGFDVHDVVQLVERKLSDLAFAGHKKGSK